jgi:hypothetical protein
MLDIITYTIGLIRNLVLHFIQHGCLLHKLNEDNTEIVK